MNTAPRSLCSPACSICSPSPTRSNCERRHAHDLPSHLDVAPHIPARCRHGNDRRSLHPRPRLRGSVYFSFVHIYRLRRQLADALDTRVIVAERSAMWGKMASCGRMVSGLCGFSRRRRPITNRPQDTILPHISLPSSLVLPGAKEVTSAPSAFSLLAFFSAPPRLRGENSVPCELN